MTRSETYRIVVLGAGYAGLVAAQRLGRRLRRTGVRVTLVNATDRFVERVRLHQLAAGQPLRDLPLRDLLAGTGIHLVVGRVTAVDVVGRTVRFETPPYGWRTANPDTLAPPYGWRTADPGALAPPYTMGVLGYDKLVYALGSGADLDSVPGVREHALTVAEAGQAGRLRSRVAGLAPGGVVAVAGGGLTGIEVAAELAEAHPDLRVELVSHGRPGGWLSTRAQRHLRRAFGRLGVGVRENVRITEVGPDGLVLGEAGPLRADAVVRAAGFRVPALAAEAGLAVDGQGRLSVDATLRSVSHPDVYGIGDAAAANTPDGGRSRMSCQTGLPMGAHAADALADLLTGRAPRPHRVRYVWQNISLGRHDGVTQFTRADDSPTGAVLTGWASARFKEAVTRGTVEVVRHPGLRIGGRR